MDAFREFLHDFRPQHLGVAFPINMLVNTVAMWLVVNHLFKTGEKESLLKCALCAILLYAISTGSILLMVFPAPIVFISAVVAWLVLSTIVIQGIFELQWGGAAILVLYVIILAAIHQAVRLVLG